MNHGRGGKKPKLIMRTKGGWEGDIKPPEIQINRNAIESDVGPISDEVWVAAKKIMQNHIRSMEVFENPLATYDKNKEGVGIFAVKLKKQAAEMTLRLEDALKDERSHDLHSIILEQLIAPDFFGEQPNPAAGAAPSLRSHMNAAWESLLAIDVLLERINIEGEVPPFSQAEIRVRTGSKLKLLAKNNDLPQKAFVQLFNIHEANSQEAYEQWFGRLD